MTGHLRFAVAGIGAWHGKLARRSSWIANTRLACGWMARVPSTAIRLNPHHRWDGVLALAFEVTPGEDMTPQQENRPRGTATSVPERTRQSLRERHTPSVPTSTPEESITARDAKGTTRLLAPDAPAAAQALPILARYATTQTAVEQGTGARMPRRTSRRSPAAPVLATAQSRDRLAEHAAARVSSRLLSVVHASPLVTKSSGLTASLAAMFDRTVAGPSAAPSLLETLAHRTTLAPAEARWRHRHGVLPSDALAAANVGSSPNAPRSVDDALRDREGTREPFGTVPVRRPFGAPGAADDDERPLRPVGLSSPLSAPAPDVPLSVPPPTTRSIHRVGPPLATPALPALLPDAVTQPPAFGLSAPAMRAATRAEDAAVAPEDLSELADKVRRILREDARRHGILLT